MKRKYSTWIVIAFLLGGLWGCENATGDNKSIEDYKRNHSSASQVNAFLRDLSPDNKTLLIQYGSPFWSKIATYDMASGSIHVFDNNENNKINVAPYFSHDGGKIVFMGGREHDYTFNLYVMDANGTNLRQITRYPEMKSKDIIYAGAPSFSPDGKRIIFSRSLMKRERAFPMRGEMHSAWDVYEVDIVTNAERRLTNYNFYEISWPYYMADGKRFIFSGEGPYNPTGKGPKDFREYEERYQKNFIFIMDGKNNDLKPAFVNGSHSYRPHVSMNDTILFISKTPATDGYTTARYSQDLFLYRREKITRLTRLNSYIEWARLSRDGSYVLFTKRADERSKDVSYWMMKSDGNELKQIKISTDMLKQ